MVYRALTYIAAMYGHEQIVDSIIKIDRLHEGGVLYVASQRNHLNVVKILLDANYDVDERSTLEGEYRRTALHAAVLNNNLDIMKLLLSRSPNMDVPDDKGETALSSDNWLHNAINSAMLSYFLYQEPASYRFFNQHHPVISNSNTVKDMFKLYSCYMFFIMLGVLGLKFSQNNEPEQNERHSYRR